MYDFEGLANEINREKQNIYVEPRSYQLLKTANNSRHLDQAARSGNHFYINRDKYKQRIQREKEAESKRK